ncbi:MAG: helix-turn-helix domain-containing protein [Nitrosomonas sp.]|nr:MAG: helix-turn-helix domain-containing protein [Nitrosomonas sp.]
MKTAINQGIFSANHIIDLLGGAFRVANILNIKPPLVSDWKSANTIPADKLIRLASKIEIENGNLITRKILFPEDWQALWPELAQQDKANTDEAA